MTFVTEFSLWFKMVGFVFFFFFLVFAYKPFRKANDEGCIDRTLLGSNKAALFSLISEYGKIRGGLVYVSFYIGIVFWFIPMMALVLNS